MSEKRKPVGTKATEAIIGASASKLSMAVKAIVESQTVLNQFAEKVDTLTLTHTDLETKIQALEQEKQNLRTLKNQITTAGPAGKGKAAD